MDHYYSQRGICGFFTTLIMLVISAGPVLLADEVESKIRGFVTPMEWQGKKVVIVGLRVINSSDRSEDSSYIRDIEIQDYRVLQNNLGRKLMNKKMLGEEVEATGVVFRDENDVLNIRLSNYNVVEKERKKETK